MAVYPPLGCRALVTVDYTRPRMPV